jgi:activating signal cointegrator 1
MTKLPPMKAITIRQPWATLIALGVKTIETRGRKVNYRGPLAIHAAKKIPATWWVSTWGEDDFVSRSGAPWHTSLESFCHSGTSSDGTWSFCDWRGPLGAIVATCTLVDCVPVLHRQIDLTSTRAEFSERLQRPFVISTGEPDELTLCKPGERWARITDQRPYGDFTPGRYGLILENIVALDEPIPAKGNQATPWNWDGNE